MPPKHGSFFSDGRHRWVALSMAIPILDLMNPNGHKVPNNLNMSILHLLAKKPSSHANGIPAYTPENTRPISVVNTDNRLIAAAINKVLAPKATNLCEEIQRGFLLNKSIIKNVIEID